MLNLGDEYDKAVEVSIAIDVDESTQSSSYGERLTPTESVECGVARSICMALASVFGDTRADYPARVLAEMVGLSGEWEWECPKEVEKTLNGFWEATKKIVK